MLPVVACRRPRARRTGIRRRRPYINFVSGDIPRCSGMEHTCYYKSLAARDGNIVDTGKEKASRTT